MGLGHRVWDLGFSMEQEAKWNEVVCGGSLARFMCMWSISIASLFIIAVVMPFHASMVICGKGAGRDCSKLSVN